MGPALKRLLLPAVLLITAMLTNAHGAPPSQDELEIRKICDEIGQPAVAKKVDLWLNRALGDRSTTTSRRLAIALGRCGGPQAARGVARLSGVTQEEVARAVLNSAFSLGVRYAGLGEFATRQLDAENLETRVMGLHLIGRIGDGSHIPVLLTAAHSENEKLRAAAFLALRSLSGVRQPNRVERWEQWWREAEPRGRRHLRIALEQLEDSPDARLDTLWRSVARRTAWIDVSGARDAATHWLDGSDRRLTLEAARLVGALRLMELRPALASARERFPRGDNRTVIQEALAALDGPRPR